jgi:hypothetical protein
MAGKFSMLKERDIGWLWIDEALNVVRLRLMFSFWYPRVSLDRCSARHFMGVEHSFIFSQTWAVEAVNNSHLFFSEQAIGDRWRPWLVSETLSWLLKLVYCRS